MSGLPEGWEIISSDPEYDRKAASKTQTLKNGTHKIMTVIGPYIQFVDREFVKEFHIQAQWFDQSRVLLDSVSATIQASDIETAIKKACKNNLFAKSQSQS